MKPLLEVVSERLDNHIETDDRAWAENRECLRRMENKLDTACDWIAEQKVKQNMSKYIAGSVGGVIAGLFLLVVDKVWK